MNISREELLVARATILYYGCGEQQDKVAELLGVSKSTVSEILKKAREWGYVLIEPNLPEEVELRCRIAELFNKGIYQPYVHIVKIEGRQREISLAIGIAAARYLEDNAKKKGLRIAFDYGRTTAAMIEALRKPLDNLKVYPIVSGPPDNPYTSVQALIARLCGRYGEASRLEPHYLPAPPVDNIEKVLRERPEVYQILKEAEEADMLFLGMGSISKDNISDTLGEMLRQLRIEPDSLLGEGAIGTCASNALNKDGEPVGVDLDKKIIKVSGESIRSAARQKGRQVILMGGGMEKVQVIRALLKGGWGNGIITDLRTAEALLEVSDS